MFRLEIFYCKKHVAGDKVVEDEVDVSYIDVIMGKRKPYANVLEEKNKTLDRVRKFTYDQRSLGLG